MFMCIIAGDHGREERRRDDQGAEAVDNGGPSSKKQDEKGPEEDEEDNLDDEDDMHLFHNGKALGNMNYQDLKAAIKELDLKTPNRRLETYRLAMRHYLQGLKSPRYTASSVVASPAAPSRSRDERSQKSPAGAGRAEDDSSKKRSATARKEAVSDTTEFLVLVSI